MALLEAHRLTAFYGDFQALYGIDLQLNEGETIAIIGANGAGKSTFLKTVAGMLRAPAERVVFDGQADRGASRGGDRTARHLAGAGGADGCSHRSAWRKIC